MGINEAGREVHDFRCKLTTYAGKLHAPGNNPDAACMDEMERAERKSRFVRARYHIFRSEIKANPSRITPPATAVSCFLFYKPGRLRFLVRF